MYSHAHGYGDEEEAESPVLCHEYRAIQQGKPKSRHRYNLYLQRNGLVFHEVGYIRAQLRMILQPVLQSSVATKEKRGREQQQRCSRQDRQKNAKNPQSQRYKA